MNIKNTLKHLNVIIRHKWYVFIACCKAGIPWRGIVHDFSKFSPTEFLTNIKYYEEGKSPINVAKQRDGYSIAWQHHKGRNPHHYEYWVDRLDEGGYPIPMPYKYAVEMICDYIGAGKAYDNEHWTISTPLEYWHERILPNAKIHPMTIEFIDLIFREMSVLGLKAIRKDHTFITYNMIVNSYNYRMINKAEAENETVHTIDLFNTDD